MERVSVARMATVKPHGWIHASLGMGVARLFAKQLLDVLHLLTDFFQLSLDGNHLSSQVSIIGF